MRKALLCAAAIIAAVAAPAVGETGSPLVLNGYVRLETIIVDDQGVGRTLRVDPAIVVPGDRLIFGTHFANASGAQIENFVVSNTVPASVRVAADVDPAVIVSVDQGQNWGVLNALTVADAHGQRIAAQPADISHIRWTIPQIAPGETGQVEFAVTVR